MYGRPGSALTSHSRWQPGRWRRASPSRPAPAWRARQARASRRTGRGKWRIIAVFANGCTKAIAERWRCCGDRPPGLQDRRFDWNLCATARPDGEGTGSCRAKLQGDDRWSHVAEADADRILAILDATGDTTLVDLKARLGQSGGTVSISALSRFFMRHGSRAKKDRRCRRADGRRHPCAPACLVRRPGRVRAAESDRRRGLGRHEDGPHARPVCVGRAAAHAASVRPSENDQAGRRALTVWDYCADGAGPGDQRRLVLGLRATASCPKPVTGRRRRQGQPRQLQGPARAQSDRGDRCNAAFPFPPAPTSTRSRWPSPRSRHSFERQPSEPSRVLQSRRL